MSWIAHKSVNFPSVLNLVKILSWNGLETVGHLKEGLRGTTNCFWETRPSLVCWDHNRSAEPLLLSNVPLSVQASYCPLTVIVSYCLNLLRQVLIDLCVWFMQAFDVTR